MNSASRTTHILTILMLVAAVALSLPGTVLSQPPTPEVYVNPAATVATTCQETTIAISVKNVVDLTGYHLDITYDSADLLVTNVVNGGFLGEPVDSEFYEPTNSWATPGVISFGMVQQRTGTTEVTPRDGDGDLIVITLKAKVPTASSPITINGTTSQLVNWPDALPITFTVTNGTVATESCAPVAVGQSVTTAEDTVKEITLGASDPDSDPLTYAYSDPAHGTVTGSGPQVSYDPDADYHGPDSFTFTASDPYGKTSNTATVNITVTPVLDQPTLSSTDLAGPYMAGLQQEFHVTLDNPSNGDAFSNVLARFRLEDINLADIASFEYLETSVVPNIWLPLPLTQDGSDVIGDFGPASGFPLSVPYNATSSFRVTFNPPVVSPTVHAASVILYDLTPEPDVALATLTANVTVVEDLVVSDVTLKRSVDQTTWFDVPGSFVGGYTMPLLTSEDWYYFDAPTITVNRPLPDGMYPFNFGTTPAGFFEYWAGREVTAASNPTDWEGVMWRIINGDLPVFYLQVTGTSYRLVDGLSFGLDGSIEYLRINGGYWPGQYTFAGTVTDEYGFDEGIGVDITFDDIPVALDQSLTTLEDTPFDLTLTADDFFHTALVWEVLSGPANGSLSGAVPALTYTPNANWHGTDTFTFQVSDGALVSNTATVTIVVTAVNDAPELTAIVPQSVNELALLTFDAAATDIDGDTAFTFNLLPPAAGIFPEGANMTPAGGFSWTPTEAQGPGTYTAVVKVCDAGLLCDEQEVTITVAEVNSAPVLDTIVAQEVNELVLLSFTAGVTDADFPANTFSYELTGTVPAGAAITAGGDFTWTPDELQGPDVYIFNVKVCDDGDPVLCDEKPVTVTVNEVNLDPVLDPIGDQSVNELVELTFTAVAADDDLPANTLIFSLVNSAAGLVPPTATIDSNTGVFSWTPGEDMGGTNHTFEVCVSDGTADDCETITVTVNDINVAPVAVNDEYETNEDVDLVVTADLGVLDNDNDSDFPDQTLTAILVTGPAHGTLTLNADGSFTYEPDQDYLGFDSFTYKANDGTADSNTATVTINVHTVNDNPVANADAYDATEDTLLTVSVDDGLLNNDTDVENQPLTAQLVSAPASGILSLNSNGSFTYMPAANVNGLITFTYRAYDSMGWSAPATVTITVAAVDDPTIALPQTVTTPEDLAKAITLAVTEVDGDTLIWTVGTPTRGTLSGTAPALTYTPNPHTFGPDSFTFSVNDEHSQSNTATVTINVTSVNDNPVAQNETFTVDEDAILFENVTATDVDNDTLTYSVQTGPVHGGLVLGLDGAFAYQPVKDYSGSDSFTFYAHDGHGGSGSATVTINITAMNDDPIARFESYTTAEDTLLSVAAPGVLENDTDVDNASLTAVLLEGPGIGTFHLNTDGSLTFQPPADYFGVVTFTYMASDGLGNSSTVIDVITVTPVNDYPVLDPIEDKTVDELVNLAFTAAASDVDPATLLAFSLEGQPDGAAMTSAGAFSWTPTEAQGPGVYTFTVKVCDNAAAPLCATQELTVTVNEVNVAPTASSQSVTTAEDTAKDVTLAAVDVDGNPLTWTIVAQPVHGTLSGTAPALTYTPAADYFGPDSFTFKVNDGTVDSNIATVTIDVTAVNDLPAAADQAVSTAYETPVDITLAATDVESDPLSWTIVDQPLHGTLSGDAPNLVYTPDAGYSGSDTFTFSVNDGTGDSNTATVTITVGSQVQHFIYLPLILR